MKLRKMVASLAAVSLLCSAVSASALKAFAYSFSQNDLPMDQREYVVVPEEYNGETVTAISTLGLALMDMKELTLPGTITTYGLECCKSNCNLEKVTLSEGLTYLGTSMFMGCIKLPRIDLPNSMKEIGSECFAGCSSLAEVHLSGNLKTIDEYAFGDTALSTVTFPPSVTTIKKHAFIGCNNMNAVLIPASVTFIGEYAFGYHKNTDSNDAFRMAPWCDSDLYEKAEYFTIYGYTGSAAEEYAEKYEFSFVALDSDSNLRGDADGDQVIDVKDAEKALIFAADYLVNPSIELTAENISMLSAADIDRSGDVTVSDAQYILLYFLYNNVMDLPTTWEQLLAEK